MHKLLALILALCSSLFAVYQVGDVIPDFNFQDTNLENDQIVTYDYSLSDLIGNKKQILHVRFFYPG